MNFDEFRTFCMSFKEVTESCPFDATTLVFKVCNKMFVLTDMATFESFNVKCNPEKAIELREKYDFVLPGYHMSKTHWNTILFDPQLSNALIKQWITDSYQEVIKTLPKKTQALLQS